MTRWPFRMAAYARRQAGPMVAVIALILVGAGLEALKPWPLKLLIDHVIGSDPWPVDLTWITRLPDAGSPSGMIAWLTAATVVLYIVSAAVRMTQTYLQAGAGSRMLYALGGDLFEHLQRLSLRFHQRNRTGNLLQRVVTDAGCARDLVVNVALPAVTSLSTLLMLFVIMWRLDWLLTTVALAVTPLIVLAIRLFANEMEVRSYEQSELEGQMMGVAEQTLTAIPIVQAFGREPHENRRFSELTERTGRAYLRMIASQLWFKLATAAATALGTSAMLLLGGWHVLDGELSVGALLVFLSYLASLYQPLESISYLMAGYASAAAGARRVLQVLDTHEAVTERTDATTWHAAADGRAPAVLIDDVTFGYETGAPVLSGVTVSVQPGERVALVGATGSGKSTLVALLPRLFDPWSGRILVGGTDVRDVTLASLRAQMAIVLQDPYLLPLTVAENISFGRPGASRDAIVAAARAAQADAFVQQMSEGYDTPIGERGVLLSGGQRQRLAIARAFLRDSPILILDEPTAALDAETEHDLMDAMQALMRGRTVVIVAHRLSTIRDVDRIYVLEAGRVVEAGNERDLLARNGAYARFHHLQHGVAERLDP